MTMIRRALRDNGTISVVSMAAVSSTLVLLGHVSSGTVSLLTKVLAVLFITFALLYPLQCILVAKRRSSGHWLVQCTAMAAYYLPTHLAFYAVNAVCSTSTSHLDESFPISVGIASMLLVTTLPLSAKPTFASNMRAYSLRDGPQDPWRFFMSEVYLGCVVWEWTRISSGNQGLILPLLSMTPHFLLALFPGKNQESNLDYETKAVAEYMKRESKSSSPFFDDGRGDGDANSSLQLDCCRYPFTQRRKDGGWISIKDLSQRADLCKEDQDIWLSYSLCRLLVRRYYGFHCAEEGDVKVRRFALARLGAEADGYKRAFTNVEVQLAFLHDYFFTTSPHIMESSFYVLSHKMQNMSQWPSASCIPSLLMLLLTVGEHNQWIQKVLRAGSYGFDLLIKAVVAMIYLPYELITPEERHLAIYWRPIHIVFHKLDLLRGPTTNIWLRFLKHIYHSANELDVHHPFQTQTSTTLYWRDKIGQYSVLLDYDRRPSLKKALVAWFLGLVRPQPWYKFIKHLPIEEEDVRVPDSVRELVAETLQATDGPPTNGTRSLKINIDSAGYDWSWTCREESHTGTILIWHIATYCCDMTPISDGLLVKWHHEAAKALSSYCAYLFLDNGSRSGLYIRGCTQPYCAYLVAFLPEFLLDHSPTTKEVFQRVLQEAQQELGTKTLNEVEKHTKIRGLQLPDQHEQRTTFHKGVELGRQLEMLNDDSVRWRVIAEFWAETILYIAPSDNAEAHMEHLAKGGEFITHLWALLSNAGIVKRAEGEWHPPASNTKLKGPPKEIETTKAITQECPF